MNIVVVRWKQQSVCVGGVGAKHTSDELITKRAVLKEESVHKYFIPTCPTLPSARQDYLLGEGPIMQY